MHSPMETLEIEAVQSMRSKQEDTDNDAVSYWKQKESGRSSTNDVDDESEIESVLLAEEEEDNNNNNKAEGVALE